MTFKIQNNEVMDKIIQSKQRFQRGPVNHALRKAELVKMKEAATVDGDTDTAQRCQDEIDEIEGAGNEDDHDSEEEE